MNKTETVSTKEDIIKFVNARTEIVYLNFTGTDNSGSVMSYFSQRKNEIDQLSHIYGTPEGTFSFLYLSEKKKKQKRN